MRRLASLLCAALAIALLALPGVAAACTLWAAAGESAAGGGTLLAKNRDWRPDHQQQLRLIVPKAGYRFISLYATGNDSPGTKAGINEKGLAGVSASPPSYLEVPENYRGKNSLRTVLTRYASVAEALAALEEGKWACGPEFLVLADGKEVASVEFGLDGAYAIVGRTGAGAVYHTNHYRAPRFAALNQGRMDSSLRRYERIGDLLAAKAVYGADDFRQYSADSVLWRTGTSPTATRTLAGWVIRQAPGGKAVLNLRLVNPGKPGEVYEFAVEELFAGRVDLSRVE